ncbi:acetyl-CoA carboxylase biotin carboxyl carrier protein [Clostridium estertheticum]|uniref:acetyl-CoA carboxylase biotin carboxyl carrier protein n=1 Tax=Clostridium estertheticum TaxID=238834 RepID=UPI0013E96C63|nr:acetyl-CoA carboxylase biotin carboxyl carrier protein [Clostridium estertheticum]MBZ9689667.1 acetyl-CoA carboxylase biotin carboxyl carrier protein [Clostridium estertheticum]
MDYKNIQELIKTVSDSQLTSFEIETEGIRIKMEKKEQQLIVERIPAPTALATSVINESVNRESLAINQRSEEKIQSNIENEASIIPEENLFVVKSPIVGTMYSSPSDESQNFVKVGSLVKKGDTLCILEAMKLMNEIESEVDGEIVEVLVLNEDMVEYGQPLFKIRKK